MKPYHYILIGAAAALLIAWAFYRPEETQTFEEENKILKAEIYKQDQMIDSILANNDVLSKKVTKLNLKKDEVSIKFRDRVVYMRDSVSDDSVYSFLADRYLRP